MRAKWDIIHVGMVLSNQTRPDFVMHVGVHMRFSSHARLAGAITKGLQIDYTLVYASSIPVRYFTATFLCTIGRFGPSRDAL